VANAPDVRNSQLGSRADLLKRLAREQRKIARRLENLAEECDDLGVNDLPAAGTSRGPTRHLRLTREKLLLLAKGLYKARRERVKFFDSQLFSEPAWDMLLDLFIAKLSHKRVSVTSLCIASGVPSTTALRYIRHLESKGVISRELCISDARINYIDLTEASFRLLKEFLEKHWAALFDDVSDISLRALEYAGD
jgi:DNA-binding MarR family transcriptional regulator